MFVEQAIDNYENVYFYFASVLSATFKDLKDP